jgi:hypothetical protein
MASSILSNGGSKLGFDRRALGIHLRNPLDHKDAGNVHSRPSSKRPPESPATWDLETFKISTNPRFFRSSDGWYKISVTLEQQSASELLSPLALLHSKRMLCLLDL